MLDLLPIIVEEQRIESHLSSVHGKGKNLIHFKPFLHSRGFKLILYLISLFSLIAEYGKRKYKKYLDDPGVPVPKSTKYGLMKNSNLSSQSNSTSSLTLQSDVFAQQEIEREQDHSTSCEYECTLQQTKNGFAESQTSLEKAQSTSTLNENEAETLQSYETFNLTCSSEDSDSECGEIPSVSDSDSVASGFFSESLGTRILIAKIHLIRLMMKHRMTVSHENHFQPKKKHVCLYFH